MNAQTRNKRQDGQQQINPEVPGDVTLSKSINQPTD